MMKVVGIDIGPSKGGHICEDGLPPRLLKPSELDCFLRELPSDVLVSWDAPLTGPPNPVEWQNVPGELTTRTIERFFRQAGRFKAPPGISVLPFSGCSHWTISRRLLGLPRVGPFDVDSDLPFSLVARNEDRPSTGRHIVEVHPAVAIWRWCAAEHAGRWEYKKSKEARSQLIQIISRTHAKRLSLVDMDDDQFDAVIAWYLAKSWLDGNGVMMLGNSETGSFLLPEDSDLLEEFNYFVTRSVATKRKHVRYD